LERGRERAGKVGLCTQVAGGRNRNQIGVHPALVPGLKRTVVEDAQDLHQRHVLLFQTHHTWRGEEERRGGEERRGEERRGEGDERRGEEERRRGEERRR